MRNKPDENSKNTDIFWWFFFFLFKFLGKCEEENIKWQLLIKLSHKLQEENRKVLTFI